MQHYSYFSSEGFTLPKECSFALLEISSLSEAWECYRQPSLRSTETQLLSSPLSGVPETKEVTAKISCTRNLDTI